MKILFLGDSITEGVGASAPEKRYVNLVAEHLNCKVLNYGVSGTRIARQKQRSDQLLFDWDFNSRASIMEKEADFVFVFGGTNDYGHGDADIGEKNSRDFYTFYGAINNLILYMIDTYGKDKLCFILPLHRCDEVGIRGKALKEFVEILRMALKNNEVDFLDFFENGLPMPTSGETDKYFCDGLHPNDKGHKWIADRVCEYLEKRFNA